RGLSPVSSHPRTPQQAALWIPVTSTGMTSLELLSPHPRESYVIDAALLEKLKAYDTPTICNALEIVDPARRLTGFTTKSLACPFPQLPPIVGYAKTATIRTTHAHELDAKKQREQRIAYYEYIAEKPQPGIMLIQDLDGPDVGFGAFWGEVMSAVHKGLGLLGVVT